MDDMLRGADGKVRLHMPGHKGVLPYELPLSWDMTELPSTDTLYEPTSGIYRAQEIIAGAAGARESFILTGGATTGIMAMLNFAAKPGQRVIISRNAHHSAISACIIGGLIPEYVWPETDETGYMTVTSEALAKAVRKSDAVAVLVTRPDYFGLCCDLRPVVSAAKEKGMAVLVDEAHGAHFNWWNSPENAGRLGADMWVQSAHKTLPALTQGAVLHMSGAFADRCGNADAASRMRSILRMLQTSSPSFLIMTSVEKAFSYMNGEGSSLLERLKSSCIELNEKLECAGFIPFHAEKINTWHCLEPDATRLVADFGGSLTGFEAARMLSERGFDVEMADFRRVVAITTVCDRPSHIAAYADALKEMFLSAENRKERGDIGAFYSSAIAESNRAPRILSPREAALGETESISIAQSEGRTAAETFGIYPPGIPLCCPGEAITKAAIELVNTAHILGASLFGVSDKAGIGHAVVVSKER